MERRQQKRAERKQIYSIKNMEELPQIGALGIIVIFTVKEVFAYLKSRKNGSSDFSAIVLELRKTNDNHLHSLEKTVLEGNNSIVMAINNNARQEIELLGEIKGLLSK